MNYKKDLHEENYKTLISQNFDKRYQRKTKSKWRDIPCLWIGRLNIAKMSFLPSLTFRVKKIPIKSPASYCLYGEAKKTQNCQHILQKKNRVKV